MSWQTDSSASATSVSLSPHQLSILCQPCTVNEFLCHQHSNKAEQGGEETSAGGPSSVPALSQLSIAAWQLPGDEQLK